VRRERHVAYLALAIVIALALLGVATPGSASRFVAVGNMVGVFVLLATLFVLAARLRERPSGSDLIVPVAVIGGVLALATGTLAWVSPSLGTTLAHNAMSALAVAGLAAAYLGRPRG
jgi:hypothetical protein